MNSSPQRNTFQAVLASSESSSYAIFLYPEDGLQFTTTFSKKDERQVPAVVAFSQGHVGLLWSSDGAFNIFANDRESLGNLAKYASLFLSDFPFNRISTLFLH